jgi:hypothetical protein
MAVEYCGSPGGVAVEAWWSPVGRRQGRKGRKEGL